MRRLLAILTLAALAGCSNRSRDNPFDPRNPNTHGAPAGFVALADDERVDLSWAPVLDGSFSGFRIYRKTDAETTFRAITGLLSPVTTRYSDLGLLNGLTHHYRLVYVFPNLGERGQAEDEATPGPARPWVADADGSQIERLTPDGRHVAFIRGGFQFPTAIAADPVSGWVWVSDNGAGNVVIFNPGTGTTTTVSSLQSPSTIALNPADHSAWVCDESGGVVQITSDGNAVASLAPFQTPIGVALNPNDGSLWIAERGGNRLWHYSSSHQLLGSLAIDLPSRVAVDSVTSAVWVTSFETRQVFRVSSAGVRDLTVGGFGGPIGVTVDSRRGTVWVADAGGNQVVILSRAGDVLARIGGLSEAREVSVDPLTGEGWAVAPGAGQVAVISSAGALLRLLGGLSGPVGISVDPGVRVLPP